MPNHDHTAWEADRDARLESDEPEHTHVVAISGGKDSVAMAVALAEKEPRDYTYLITPTGNELPAMEEHWQRLEVMLGKPFTRVSRNTLQGLIEIQNALPSNRMRWCTRMLKIEPCIAWLKNHQPATLYVGLRADEEERQGLYAEDVAMDFPMRRWGWTEADVWEYLYERGIQIPYRTDCAWCYDQRLSQWRRLLQDYPAIYQQGIEYEKLTGHTFRNPKRDTWPADLESLRAEFEKGRIPRGADDQMDFFDQQEHGRCRLCTL
jgi:hypothetical protein